MKSIRVAHFSDVHLTSPKLGWGSKDVLSKKVTGWINVKLLGRGRRFRHASKIAPVLVQNLKTRNYDLSVFTGDATKLSFESEFRIASEKLCVSDPQMPKTICVPGNHDYYIRKDMREGKFEQYFSPWLQGQRIDSEVFPFAVQVGHCSFIAVNSARANFWSFDATGRIGSQQFDRLKKLCETLPNGPRILITHYPLRKANRKLEAPTRRLRDHRNAIITAKECGISLWLHGHIHQGYTLEPGDDIPFPIVCVGSATQTQRWMYNEYEIDGYELLLRKRVYQPDSNSYEEAFSQKIILPRY